MLRRRHGHVAAAVATMVAAAWASTGAITPARAASGATTVPAGCASTQPGGGNWPLYGADLANSRTQPAESTIDATKAATLAPRWVFPVTAGGGTGTFNSTPIVADGCVFAGTSSGDVVAVNADTGKQLWRTNLSVPNETAGLGGLIVGATVVDAGRVYVLVDQQADGTGNGPYAVALDEGTGKVVWTSAPFDTASGDYTNATPVVIPVHGGDGPTSKLIFAGFSPAEGDSHGQGGFVLLDAATGHTVVRTYTIPAADRQQGYAGGGIWSAPAFDPSTGFAYVGASNPYSKTKEHPNTNAILKIDLNRGASFGQIVGSYKGNVDQYNKTLQTLSQSPACAASDVTTYPLDDPVCGQLDLDFGASVNLFTAGGRALVGGLQKAGVYHAADAATMQPSWQTIVGGPCAVCNAASTAVGPTGVYGVGAPGGVAFGLDRSSGSAQWMTPDGGGAHYESISTANGVVYTFDTEGFLDGFDAATGAVVLHRQMAQDTGAVMASLTSAGVAIARHTVFVAADDTTGNSGNGNGYLVAYQPAA